MFLDYHLRLKGQINSEKYLSPHRVVLLDIIDIVMFLMVKKS